MTELFGLHRFIKYRKGYRPAPETALCVVLRRLSYLNPNTMANTNPNPAEYRQRPRQQREVRPRRSVSPRGEWEIVLQGKKNTTKINTACSGGAPCCTLGINSATCIKSCSQCCVILTGWRSVPGRFLQAKDSSSAPLIRMGVRSPSSRMHSPLLPNAPSQL
jgi:hypothetical protein